MPLLANVWYEQGEVEPSMEPDAQVACSLSPIRPEELLQGTAGGGQAETTHIIRTASGQPITDNYYPRGNGSLFPCTVWEFPQDSAHFYVTVWAHVVGRGFPNEHARVYVTRWRFEPTGGPPLFTGWV
jgi:hypothetical protein